MANTKQIAVVQHYQDGGCGGSRQEIEYTGLDSVIAWSDGQSGHPWDGASVVVYAADDTRRLNPLETYEISFADGAYEVV